MLTEDQQLRYSRQLALDEIAHSGQELLLDSSVLVVGAGGLGTPLLTYLAAAGVGKIGVIDADRVDLSNLQRQTMYNINSVGKTKVSECERVIRSINQDINVECYSERLTALNAHDFVSSYDIVADGSDNFETRFTLNDICYHLGKTLVSAAVSGFNGQLSTFKAYKGKNYPCYRCFCPDVPQSAVLPNCMDNGVLGSVVGVMGSMQATEVIKELLDLEGSMAGKVLFYNALEGSVRVASLPVNEYCQTCGVRRQYA